MKMSDYERLHLKDDLFLVHYAFVFLSLFHNILILNNVFTFKKRNSQFEFILQNDI